MSTVHVHRGQVGHSDPADGAVPTGLEWNLMAFACHDFLDYSTLAEVGALLSANPVNPELQQNGKKPV